MTSHLELGYKQPPVAGGQVVPIRRPMKMTFENIKQLRDDHAEVDSGHQTLQQELAALGASPETMALLEHVRSAARRTQSHSRDLWRMVPAPHRPSAASARVAEKAFETAELLEEILTYLPLDQILTAMRVQKSWCNTVKGSVKLLRVLGLAPPASEIFDSPFSSRYINKHGHTPENRFIPGLSLPSFMSFRETDIWKDWDTYYLYQKSETELAEHIRNVNLLDLTILCRPCLGREPGKRIAKVEICTPRICELSFAITCPCKAGNFTHKPATWEGEAKAVTVETLVDCTHELLRTYGHVKMECVAAEMKFHAKVKLSDTDPIVLHRKQQMEVIQKDLRGHGVGQRYSYATKLFFIGPGREEGRGYVHNRDTTRYIDEDDEEDASDEESGQGSVHEGDDEEFDDEDGQSQEGGQESQDEDEEFQGEDEEVQDADEEPQHEAEDEAR
ncbi:hypothetical protein CB0940_03949 [Cercospora beticola]|uniref:F-box domain-containing protein n=1 Tax=Cercospora beticola TaxID=122368 RepID=A0A2G5HM22_CERBT|nr:hypothetical protein CB0940_03949 [Cercospora beticola]PIA93575.1 hypothetical protein CB0940_03949 [Cercospora beticola]WPB01152.1 hypothetical protein RHO25_005773 [Cercospora beticola]CAK1364096.1 unnamed protein product [Cercospora beticola]